MEDKEAAGEAKVDDGGAMLPADGGSGGVPPPARPAAAAVQLRPPPGAMEMQSSMSRSFGKAASATVALAAAEAAAASAAAPPKPTTLGERMRQWRKGAERLWYELPTACKATLILAVANFVLSVSYATAAVALTSGDEELHISLIILISSVFVLVSVADAIVYENTLELATSIVIDTLVLARVIFFAFENGSKHEAFKITWTVIMLVVQSFYIVVAILAYREFGWRLYSKLGVDFREKGAADKMRLAILRNSYSTLLKINVMLMLVLVALGIDVSVEKRGGDILVDMLCVSCVGLLAGVAATWLAVVLVVRARRRRYNPQVLVGFHAAAAACMGQAVATVVIYQYQANDVANASISLHVAAVVYMATTLALWLSTQLMYNRYRREWRYGTPPELVAALSIGRAGPVGSTVIAHDPLLSCMHAGAWIGKPTARNPNKRRFFQLSYDGSTLRWGWNRFVRLYYIDDLSCDDASLAMTLTFPFDAELVLKFTSAAVYHAWRRALAHLLLMLMAPDAPPPMEAVDEAGRAVSGPVLLGNTSSRELVGLPGMAAMSLITGSPGAAAAPSRQSGSDAPGSVRRSGPLGGVSARLMEAGRRLAGAARRPSHDDRELRRRSEQGGAASEAATSRGDRDDEEAGGDEPGGEPGSARSRRSPPTSTPAAARAAAAREAERSLQMQKRQRMAAYLQSIAAAAHPAAPRSRRPPPVTASAAAAAALAAGTEPALDGSPPASAPLAPRRSRASVSIGVQTDESELLSRASSWASPRARSGLEAPLSRSRLRRLSEDGPDVEPATPAAPPAAAAAPTSDGGDADVAAQYAAAMAAQYGAAAAAAGTSSGAPAAQQPASDADVAAQYAAAMAAAGGGGTPPSAQQQQQQGQRGGALAAGSGAPDSDVAAEYLMAMQAAAVGGGALATGPPPARTPLGGETPRASGFAPPPRRSTSSVSPAAVTPLEQLAYQQQQAASARLASLTPGSLQPYSQGISAPGGGLWQLAAAVDVIDYEELSFGKLLGAGAEGAVYAAWFLESPVAVKKFERAEDSLHEVEMYLQLGSHDNVVALRGLCQHDGSMFLVLEYCPRGTLDVMLHHSARHAWDPDKLLPLVRSIARGMHYLHSRNILHRDLKPANIFVGHGQMMKIGDFGMARIVAHGGDGPPTLHRLTPGTVGTTQYCAPELVNEDLRPQGVDEMEWALKLDVWSFGVTLWEIMERRRPFEGLSQNAVQALWMADPYAARLPPVRLPDFTDRAGKRVFRGLSDLVEDCTRLDPYARPSSRDILLRLKSLAALTSRKGSGHMAPVM